MSGYYQHVDAPHFDYQITALPGSGPWRFRGPAVDISAPFVACIGAAQTFGRFVHDPFPAILGRRLGLPCMNLGIGGIGPRFWLQPEAISALRRARLVVVQVMAGRSASNSLFDNSDKGDLHGVVRATGERMRFEQFFENLVAAGDREVLQRVVAETRDDYVATMNELGKSLDAVPTVLLWISRRVPHYVPDWRTSSGLMRHFPQLLDQGVVDRIRGSFTTYVECVSENGLPQRLWQSNQAVLGARLADDGYLYNEYYPSPQMHELAADKLTRACARLLAGEIGVA